MEDLSVEDLKQLLHFYMQKSSDLEFKNLQLQIQINKNNTINQAASLDHL